MTLRRSSIWLMAALALLPVLLFVYLGQFTRPMDWDDLCFLRIGQQGVLGGTLHWLRHFTGSYASYFLLNALTPLGTLAPPIMTTLIIVLWLFGSFWLVFEGLARLGINRRRPLAAAAAALAVAAVLNSLHSPQSLYWYADDYILLLPLLLLHLALWLRPLPSSAWRLIAGAALCFIAAGASEIGVGIQLAFFTFCLLMSFALLPSSARRPHALFFGAGWLATLAGFIIQLSAPGAAHRAAATVDHMGMPDQPLSDLMSDAFSRTFGYLGHPPLFGGFAMLLGVGMLVMLFGYRPPALPKPSKAISLVLPALWLGLIFQLLWLPALFEQASRDPLAFRSLFGLNMALILAFLALIWQRRRVQAHLQKQARGLLIAWHMTACAVLFALLFLIPQSGDVESGGGYLLTTALALLGLLFWQLSSLLPGGAGFGWLAPGLLGLGLATLTASAAMIPLITRGETLRFLSPSDCLLVLSGLVWGLFFGCLVKHYPPGRAWERLLKLVSLTMILIIGISIMLTQAALIPNFQLYAQEWDERHLDIIAQRGSGQRVVEVPPFTWDLHMYLYNIPASSTGGCLISYYDIDEIVFTDG